MLREPRSVADRLDALHEQLEFAARRPPTLDCELVAYLDVLSDELNELARGVGLDAELGRRLLALRTRIDSFVLAASALNDAHSSVHGGTTLLRRAVNEAVADLQVLASSV